MQAVQGDELVAADGATRATPAPPVFLGYGQPPWRAKDEWRRDADLLVVGTRGHGGFAGMLLGSVSQHVTAHASCTVAVVR